MHVIIFANGKMKTFGKTEKFRYLLDNCELIIAADGGANHCHNLGITPDIIIGDFDSIQPDVFNQYQTRDIEIVRYPRRKDASDLELSLEEAVKRGGDTISLMGALGGRWDMSLANILLASGKKFRNKKVSLYDNNCSMSILEPNVHHQISGTPGDRISLLPLHGNVYGVTLKSFEYPLDNHTIESGSSLGVSNVLTSTQADVIHTNGILLCIQYF